MRKWEYGAWAAALAAWVFVLFAPQAYTGWYDFSTTAASNTTINGVAFPIGATPPSNVGPGFRANAEFDAKFLDDANCATTSSGTDTITFDAASNPYSGSATYADGDVFCFTAGGTNTGAATFNVDLEGAKALRKEADVALVSGDIVTGARYRVTYCSTCASAAGAFVLPDSPRTMNGRTLATATLTSPTVNGITNGTGLAAGTYTPTDSANSNLDSATPSTFQYMRVGATVTVSGVVVADATGAGTTSFQIDLPVASNFSAVEQCVGVSHANTDLTTVAISANGSNDTCSITYTAVTSSAQNLFLIFTYRVI